MAETIISAKLREDTGKGAARALRRDNRVPAIIYGGGKSEVKISLDQKELTVAYNRGAFVSKLTELKADKETFLVIPRDVQLHPVTDAPLHADFMHVDPKSKINLMVKVEFQNAEKSPGLKRGGILNIVRHNIELICSADSIPSTIVVDLSGYKIGDSIHVSAITLPEDVIPTIKDRDFTIATIAGRTAKNATADDDASTEEESTEAAAE